MVFMRTSFLLGLSNKIAEGNAHFTAGGGGGLAVASCRARLTFNY